MPASLKGAIGLCGVGAIAVGAGVAGLQALPGETGRTPLDKPPVRSVPVSIVPRAVTETVPIARPARPAAEAMTTLGAQAVPAVRRAAGQRLPAGPAAAAQIRAVGAHAYSAMVQRIARRYSVEWKLVMAIIASESGGDPNAVSRCGAVGLMQLMPDTATHLGVDPWDPEQNVEGAVRYLSSLLTTFGSVDLTLVAYNAGPGFAKRYKEGTVELGAETRAFLMRVGDRLN